MSNLDYYINKYLNFFNHHKINLKSNFLIGVSGGLDSMALLDLSFKFVKSYIDHVSWEDKNFFTKRLLDITPLLLLARVDGKSPVEYFKVKQQELTRQLGKHILTDEIKTLEQLYSIFNNYVIKKLI